MFISRVPIDVLRGTKYPPIVTCDAAASEVQPRHHHCYHPFES